MSQGTAIITGAGQGIGEAIAKKLAEEGYKTVVNDVNSETAEKTVKEIKQRRKFEKHKSDLRTYEKISIISQPSG